MTYETCRMVRADHPSLPGHFPGAPIVPGVMILDEVAAAVAQWRSGARVVGMPVVKFMLPLQPEQSFTISLATGKGAATRVDFRCYVEERTIAEGRLEIDGGAIDQDD